MTELICPRNSDIKKIFVVEVKRVSKSEVENIIKNLKNEMKKVRLHG
jgi:hypothetical protein